MTGNEEKYWYNLRTGQVEHGFESPSAERAGPFDSAEDAARAPQVMAARSKAWAEEEAREDDWGNGRTGDVSANGEGDAGR